MSQMKRRLTEPKTTTVSDDWFMKFIVLLVALVGGMCSVGYCTILSMVGIREIDVTNESIYAVLPIGRSVADRSRDRPIPQPIALAPSLIQAGGAAATTGMTRAGGAAMVEHAPVQEAEGRAAEIELALVGCHLTGVTRAGGAAMVEHAPVQEAEGKAVQEDPPLVGVHCASCSTKISWDAVRGHLVCTECQLPPRMRALPSPRKAGRGSTSAVPLSGGGAVTPECLPSREKQERHLIASCGGDEDAEAGMNSVQGTVNTEVQTIAPITCHCRCGQALGSPRPRLEGSTLRTPTGTARICEGIAGLAVCSSDGGACR